MVVAAFALVLSQAQPVITPRAGLVITASGTVPRREYPLASTDDSGQTAVLTIRGKGITVDFQNATFRGTPATVPPNERKGTFLWIEGEDITIKNLRAHGYKLGVIAVNSPRLKILDSDLSYQWKQRLNSTTEREDLSDWMSFHQNEKDEWLRFGAAIYLRGCHEAEVKNVRSVGGQCGLMMTGCDKGTFWNNEFSFLSAIGIGMYRSSDNKIMHNNLDWCVRGYSHGVYNRGQDSAGILIYEQSHRNVFAYNSVTHGGDGFFLWAGQTTMDTGKGGCNDNLLFGNDFSHAPTNGIEVTFSRNRMINNLILECWHGIWGGYSYESVIARNVFGLNAEGIAIEHGQDNAIEQNIFDRDLMAIRLWQNKSQDPNWGYPKNRDTRSRDYLIKDNNFRNSSAPAVAVTDTMNVLLAANVFERNADLIRLAGENPGLSVKGNVVRTTHAPGGPPFNTGNSIQVDAKYAPLPPTMQPSGNVILDLDPLTEAYLERFNVPWRAIPVGGTAALPKFLNEAPAPLDEGNVPFLPPGTLRGRRYILVDEWGPYDFQSPKLWLRKKETVVSSGGTGQLKLTFEVLGPAGTWQVKKADGVRFDGEQKGSVPGRLVAYVDGSASTEIDLQLSFTGGRVVDYRGVVTDAGKEFLFGYQKFWMPIDWQIQHFHFDQTSQDPRTQEDAFRKVISGPPIHERKATELNGAWGGSPAAGVRADYFATVAVGSFWAKPGKYRLNVTSDDGVRVYLDGKRVIDNWTYHGPTLDTADVTLTGKHTLRVEHFELNGYSTLKVEVIPVRN